MHIVKITGTQGAGKSEALGHLAKMYPATYRIYLAGRDI